MVSITFHAIPTRFAAAAWRGEVDANGGTPEHFVSDGEGVPCRHCLRNVPAGKPALVLALRPFETLQAYAECGPVFLCGTPCERAVSTGELPAILESPSYITRGYSMDERIVYGTGGVTPTNQIVARAEALLKDPGIAFVDVRSAANNCFQCRIERA